MPEAYLSPPTYLAIPRRGRRDVGHFNRWSCATGGRTRACRRLHAAAGRHYARHQRDALARREPTRTASASQLRTLNRLRAEALGDLATGIDAGDPHSGATATKNFASKRAFLLAVQLTGRPACAREAAACDRTVESTQGRETARAVKTTAGAGKTRIGSSPNFEPSEPVRFLRGRPERRRCEQDDACSAAAING